MMKMTVVNKCIKAGNVEIAGIGNSSMILIGDAGTIVNSSYFDTPADSLIFSPFIPLRPVYSTASE